ncbi:hypothetical protein ACO0RG_002096 [Hanseniaspora osmophila]
MSETVAPSLSTFQADYLFQKYEQPHHARPHLNQGSTETSVAQQLNEYYSVSEILDFLITNPQYEKITLQFPDHLVMDSAYILKDIQAYFTSAEDNKRQFWILADTAYSSCCVDEVAAEHVKGDLVIHFGDACLNSVQKLPVAYSFGKPKLSQDVAVQFEKRFPDKNDKVCLMSDSSHCYLLPELSSKLKENGYTNVIYTGIPKDIVPEGSFVANFLQNDKIGSTKTKIGRNRVVFSEHEVTQEELQQDYTLFHITTPADPHLLFLTTSFANVVLYDPSSMETFEGPFPSMMKRYKFMHVARTAGTIGILVNTLSLKNTKETINALTKLIKSHDKKSYLFVVGKPNVAKLANFESIDVWCILGCPQSGIIVDQYNEFYKPVITPYELQLSLQYDVTWTGKWVTQFEDVLKEIDGDMEADENDTIKEDADLKEKSGSTHNDQVDDMPVFSAVTGKYVSTSRPLRHVQHLELDAPTENQTSSNSLVKNFSSHLTIKNTVSTSAAALQNRTWTGLGSDFAGADEGDAEEEGATLQLGIAGVARGYAFDRENTEI